MKNSMFKRYLLWFANDHADFRLSEVESIAALFKTSIKWIEKPSSKPYCIAELPSDDIVRQIASRSLTLKYVSEIWTRATNTDELHKQLRAYSKDILQEKYGTREIPFKINVTVYCNSQSSSEKLAKINSFDYLPFKGPVKLKNPEITLQYFEFYGTDANNIPDKPIEVFFGMLVAKSQRKIITNFSLKKRKFIGNTSMDAELAFIMANQAKVSTGDLIIDPFVGTGSLLVAAAYFGCYVMGVDIDFLTVHGKIKPTRFQDKNKPRVNESILVNMKQYELENQYIDVVVGDSSLPLWRSDLVFDAIVTDPPYGMRESGEKIGYRKKREKVSENSAESYKDQVHYPSKVEYQFHHVIQDLLRFSAAHLKLGGRLVTWIPVFRADYNEQVYIPEHSCFSLLSNCEQILTKVISRRLLTFEKIREPMAILETIPGEEVIVGRPSE